MSAPISDAELDEIEKRLFLHLEAERLGCEVSARARDAVRLFREVERLRVELNELRCGMARLLEEDT